MDTVVTIAALALLGVACTYITGKLGIKYPQL